MTRTGTPDPGALPQKGDHAAFAAYYRQYEGAVTAFMRRRVDDSELSADLTMEVFAAVLLAIHRETATPKNSIAWLFGIAHHKLIDARRTGHAEDRARRQLSMEPVALQDADIERIDGLTQEASVLELLEALPPEQRDAVRARILDDRDYDDIAAGSHSSEMAVRQRVSRGLRTLRTEMEKAR